MILYENCVSMVLNTFPDFANSKELEEGYDREISYLLYAGFADYFARLVTTSINPETDQKILNVITFLEDMAIQGDHKTKELFYVGFFEALWGGSAANADLNIQDKVVKFLLKMIREPVKTELVKFMEWTPSAKL